MEKPEFLNHRENQGLVQLLRQLYGRQTRLQLNHKVAPWLYAPTPAADIDLAWFCLQQLQRLPGQLLNAPDLALLTPEDQPRLGLTAAGKTVVAEWLQLNFQDPDVAAWQQALALYRTPLGDAFAPLLVTPLLNTGYRPEAVVAALARLTQIASEQPQHSLTLRRLSAQACFGDSKFLEKHFSDNRFEQVFAGISQRLQPRSLLFSVALPEVLQALLIIENLDTFLWLVAHQRQLTPTMALVYGQGYKVSAARIRDSASVSFAYLQGAPSGAQAAFESSWFSTDSESATLPVYFWGDLDFAAMDILRSLRQGFATAQAWQPGYNTLLQCLPSGHEPAAADKQLQRQPLQTGCDFADQTLIPAMQVSARYVDQEAATLADLHRAMRGH